MAITLHCECGQTFRIGKRKATKYARCPRCQTAVPNPRWNAILGGRIRELREELYGPDGGPVLAALLGIPQAEWQGVEAGIAIPGHLVLLLMVHFDVSGDWLLDGQGPKFGQPTGEIS